MQRIVFSVLVWASFAARAFAQDVKVVDDFSVGVYQSPAYQQISSSTISHRQSGDSAHLLGGYLDFIFQSGSAIGAVSFGISSIVLANAETPQALQCNFAQSR